MDSRLIKPKATMKPSMLKDYLLDDVSSCSSNGFKSFPRRQCRTSTVRFLLEFELKQQQQQQQHKFWNIDKTLNPLLPKLPSKSALAAFRSVVAATVKRLSFGGAAVSPENARLKNSLRNLSNQILKKIRFWKRKPNGKEIQRWKSFDELLKEDSEPSEISGGLMAAAFTAAVERSNCNSRSNSPQTKNDDVGATKNYVVVAADSTSSMDTADSTNSSAKQEEKQRLSPVSVLDCPFDDVDDEEISSPFLPTLISMEGSKKIYKFEPVNLVKRFVLVQKTNNQLGESSSSIDLKSMLEQDDKDQNLAEIKARDLLNQMKDTLPSYGIKVKADKLLLHFFKEEIIANNAHSHNQQGGYSFREDLLVLAENWINGRMSCDAFLAWELPRNREAYIRDIEKFGEWKSLDREHNEVGLELEGEIFSALLSELLVDISSKLTI